MLALERWEGDARAVLAPEGHRAYELSVAAKVLGVVPEAVRRRTTPSARRPLTSWRVRVGRQDRVLVAADEVDAEAADTPAGVRVAHDAAALANLAEAVELLRREVSDLRNVHTASAHDEVERLKAVIANHRRIEALHQANEALLTDELPNH